MTPRFDLIGIVSADMARSLAFYQLLGLDIPTVPDGAPHVEVTLAGGLRVAWDSLETMKALDPGWVTPSGSARIALAFDCGEPAEVDAMVAILREAGAGMVQEPKDQPWGQRYAVVSDPDGNAVDLFAALKG